MPLAKKKHIVFTVTNDLSYDQRMARICESLSKAGYEVTLIGFLRKNSIPLDGKAYDQKRVNVFFKKGKLFYFEYNLKLFLHFLMNRYDIHSAIDLDTVLASYLSTRLFPKRTFVLDAHELYLGLPEVERRPSVYKIWSRLEKWIYPKIKHAYTVNESLANHYKEKYDLDMTVIRNFPKTSIKSSIKEEDTRSLEEPIIIYQGWLNEGRGLEALVESMKDIQAKLWLVGEGEISERLRELPKRFSVQDKVVFKGFVPPEELKALSPKATIGVNLLDKRSINYYFSLANKFFDYIEAGIPQITMAFPEYEKLNAIHEVAVLVEDLKADSISNAINDLLASPSDYRYLKNNISKARELWTWETEAPRLIEFYKNLENA